MILISSLTLVNLSFLNRRRVNERVIRGARKMIFSFDFIGDLVGKVSTLKRKLHAKSKQRPKERKTSM